MARGSRAMPRYDSYHEDDDDEPTAEGSGSRSTEDDSDVEQGLLSPGPSEQRPQNRAEGWLSMLSSSIGNRQNIGNSQRVRSRSPSPEDRNR